MQESSQVSTVMLSKGEVLTIRSDRPVREAAEIMRNSKVGCLVVMHPGDRVAGIVTERDIVSKVVAESANPDTVRVSDIMSAKVIAISPTASLARARQVMSEYKIRHLPVIRGGKLEGLVSSRDILSVELRVVQEVVEHQDQLLREAERKCPGITQMKVDAGGRILI
ncbi:MAG: CBS domain-containing protein [Phycisphaerae bacterium]|nr:CBS domain-containing protein [Phycisphaerae bacterium]